MTPVDAKFITQFRKVLREYPFEEYNELAQSLKALIDLNRSIRQAENKRELREEIPVGSVVQSNDLWAGPAPFTGQVVKTGKQWLTITANIPTPNHPFHKDGFKVRPEWVNVVNTATGQ
jgi:hypothetical protein